MSQITKDILINRAISLFNEGSIKKSLKEALIAKKKYPDEPFIYNLLGVLYAQMESYNNSIKNYSKAIKLNPKYFEAYNNIGVAYSNCQKNNKAIECGLLIILQFTWGDLPFLVICCLSLIDV